MVPAKVEMSKLISILVVSSCAIELLPSFNVSHVPEPIAVVRSLGMRTVVQLE